MNPHDPTSWQNVNLVALSPRGREVARRIAATEALSLPGDAVPGDAPDGIPTLAPVIVRGGVR